MTEKEKEKIAEVLRQFQEQYDRKLDELRATVDGLREKGEKTVTARPLLTLSAAFALGLSLGIALARSK